MKKTLSKIAMAVMCGLTVSTTAFAADTKVYPGGMCQKYTGDGVKLIWFGATHNSSASATLNLDCPVVRDETGYGLVSGSKVRVIDRSSAAVTCEIQMVHDVSVTSRTWWATGRRSSVGTGVQDLTFGVIGPNNPRAHLVVGCDVPPTEGGLRSGVISYQIAENSPPAP
jgi:hypothetical protein